MTYLQLQLFIIISLPFGTLDFFCSSSSPSSFLLPSYQGGPLGNFFGVAGFSDFGTPFRCVQIRHIYGSREERRRRSTPSS